MAHRAFPLLFYSRPRDNRNGWLHTANDLLSAFELLDVLADEGFRYGDPLLNIPPREDLPTGAPQRPLAVDDLDAEDLVILTTRPPLGDMDHKHRRSVYRGWTDVEQLVLDRVGQVFENLSSGEASLSKSVRSQLPAEFVDRGQIEFQLNWPPRYTATNGRDGRGWLTAPRGEWKSAGYLLRLGSLWPDGPGLLAVFGMHPETTLFWARFLRQRHRDFVRKRGFVMGELGVPDFSAVPMRLGQADCQIVMQCDEELFAANSRFAS